MRKYMNDQNLIKKIEQLHFQMLESSCYLHSAQNYTFF